MPVGVLICYEDIFPALARENTLAGADVLAVLTNNAWYGEGGAAYQHAAHSVLRAVENRRPVVRCGNGGWSGWIDEYGNIRDTLRDENGTIYFRGHGHECLARSPLAGACQLLHGPATGLSCCFALSSPRAPARSSLRMRPPAPPQSPDEANF